MACSVETSDEHPGSDPPVNFKSSWDRPCSNSPYFTYLSIQHEHVWSNFLSVISNSKRSTTKISGREKQNGNNGLNSISIRRIWFHASSLCRMVWIHFLSWCTLLFNFSLDLNEKKSHFMSPFLKHQTFHAFFILENRQTNRHNMDSLKWITKILE